MITQFQSLVILLLTLSQSCLWSSLEAFSPIPILATTSQRSSKIYYRISGDVVVENTPTTPLPSAATTTAAPVVLPPSNKKEVAELASATTIAVAVTTTVEEEVAEEPATSTKRSPMKRKPTIHTLRSLDELQFFLEEEDRPTIIKFYAPWCKSCQRLGQHFTKLAMEQGDYVESRHKVQGKFRFAQVEYSDETKFFLTEQLQIRQVPTLQVYVQKYKVFEQAGMTNTKDLVQELKNLSAMMMMTKKENGSSLSLSAELLAHAAFVDDGILEMAIEDSFFDGPSFLNEEW